MTSHHRHCVPSTLTVTDGLVWRVLRNSTSLQPQRLSGSSVPQFMQTRGSGRQRGSVRVPGANVLTFLSSVSEGDWRDNDRDDVTPLKGGCHVTSRDTVGLSREIHGCHACKFMQVRIAHSVLTTLASRAIPRCRR